MLISSLVHEERGRHLQHELWQKPLIVKIQKKTGDPCNVCEFCLASDQGNFVDLIEIDGASNRKIEHARALIEKIHFAPTMGKRKVYIIDEVHMLTKEAFNALLKTIEEPPEHAYFLLATTELQKVPETIRSRCQVFTFHRFTEEQIVSRLQEIAQKEGIEVDSRDALALIANRSAGGLRDAIGLFEQASASGRVSVEHLQRELGIVASSQLDEFYLFLVSSETENAISFVGEISSEGLSLDDFLEQFLGLLRQKMLFFATEENNPNALASVLLMIDAFDIARRSMRDTPIPTLPLEIAIITVTRINTSDNSSQKDDSGGWNIFGKKSEKPPSSSLEKTERQKPKVKSDSSVESEKKSAFIKAESDSIVISEENVKLHWPKVLEKIDDAMLRAALGQAIVSCGNEDEISIVFAAESWMKQVEDSARFARLQRAVQEVFGPESKLLLSVGSVILQPIEKTASVDSNDEKPVTDPAVVSEILGSK
jgi:DNA polymerase III subunit gamma/tau